MLCINIENGVRSAVCHCIWQRLTKRWWWNATSGPLVSQACFEGSVNQSILYIFVKIIVGLSPCFIIHKHVIFLYTSYAHRRTTYLTLYHFHHDFALLDPLQDCVDVILEVVEELSKLGLAVKFFEEWFRFTHSIQERLGWVPCAEKGPQFLDSALSGDKK